MVFTSFNPDSHGQSLTDREANVEAQKLARRLDSNGDGVVSYEECEVFLKSRYGNADAALWSYDREEEEKSLSMLSFSVEADQAGRRSLHELSVDREQIEGLPARILHVTLERHLHRDLGLKAAEVTAVTIDGSRLEEGSSLNDTYPEGLGGKALGLTCTVPAAAKPLRKRR